MGVPLKECVHIVHEMFVRGYRIFGIDFAPLFIPIKRRLETAAVAHFMFIWIILPLMSLWLPIFFLFYSSYWWLFLLYVAFTIYDWDRPAIGGYNWAWYRRSSIWKHFADYFPIKLVKTADLSAEKNYIIGSHPHGVLSVGVFTNLLTSANGFQDHYPGLSANVLTLNGQFYFPFRRDVGIGLGGVEASRRSLEFLLENPGKGRAIAIVIGGASEALDAHPGKHDLNLSARRGFCQYAIKYGADLVPMYNFGENDIFDQCENPRGSRLRDIQNLIKKKLGFCPPLMRGRGLFNYTIGILPFRRPITSVIGAPIPVKKNPNPTVEEVELLHSLYCQALNDLFETHKHLHSIPKNVKLNIY